MRTRSVLVALITVGCLAACEGNETAAPGGPSPSPSAIATETEVGAPVGFVAFEEGPRFDIVDSCRNEAGDLVGSLPDGGAFFLIGAEAGLFHVNLLTDGSAAPLFTDADAPVELVISGGDASGEAPVLKTEGGTAREVTFVVPWEEGGPGCKLDSLRRGS